MCSLRHSFHASLPKRLSSGTHSVIWAYRSVLNLIYLCVEHFTSDLFSLFNANGLEPFFCFYVCSNYNKKAQNSSKVMVGRAMLQARIPNVWYVSRIRQTRPCGLYASYIFTPVTQKINTEWQPVTEVVSGYNSRYDMNIKYISVHSIRYTFSECTTVVNT